MATTLTLTTYADLTQWAEAFLQPDGLGLLFLVGNPGAGKSRVFLDRMTPNHAYLRAARLTAIELYKMIYRHRHKELIFDDVDDVLKDRSIAHLLMSVCETDNRKKTVAWRSSTSLLKTEQPSGKIVIVKKEFETDARVCLISNDWKILTTKFAALLDRGTVLFFKPSAEEIHQQVKDWFTDKEIYNYIEAALPRIELHSMRYYSHAAEIKRLGLDWEAALEESWEEAKKKTDPIDELIRQLVADASFAAEEDRVAEFVRQTGKSRRTYFGRKKALGL